MQNPVICNLGNLMRALLQTELGRKGSQSLPPSNYGTQEEEEEDDSELLMDDSLEDDDDPLANW